MKHYLLLIVLCCYALLGKAETETASDSLLHVYRSLPHDTIRLNVLCKVIKIEQNNLKCIQFADTLMKEAKKLKSDKYICLSAYYHTVYYYNRCNQDSVSKWVIKMEPFAKASGLWDYFFDAKRFQIDLYTYEERFELAINEANKMKLKASEMNNNRGLVAANQCLSNAYIGSQRWEDGLKALEDAYKLLLDKNNPVVHISVLTQLVSAAKQMENYSKQFKYLQELENVLNNHIKANPSLAEGYTDVFIFNELFYAQYYLTTNQTTKVIEHLVKAKNYLNENTFFMYKILYFDTYASYYQHLNQHQQASQYIDTTLNMLKKNFPSDYAEQLLKKAKIWMQAGESDIALPLYQQALAIKDSARMTLSNTQMEQIKNSYNLDKIELEQNKQNNKIRLICLIVILLILIILFTVMYRASLVRKALKNSEAEIRKSAETVRNANEMKNRFLTNMSYNIRTPLNNVVGFSQLIASEPEMNDEVRQEYSNIIYRSSEYLLKLVNDVLDLSRLEAKMMKFQLQVYEVVALCHEACYMANMRNDKSGIKVLFSTDIEPQNITTDTSRLVQALLSTLTYPQEYEEERIIQFILSREGEELRFRISNSPLADPAFTSQETYIRNDINLLLLEHFGGTYKINAHHPEGPEIVFTYPIVLISE